MRSEAYFTRVVKNYIEFMNAAIKVEKLRVPKVPTGVSYAVNRGEKIVKENNYQLP